MGEFHASIEDITAALEVATGSRTAAERIVQLVAKWLRADYRGIITDCSALVESGDLPPRTDCRAVAVAPLATLLAGNPVGAFADIEGALANSDFSGEDLGRLIGLIVKLAFKLGGLDAFDYLVESFVHTVEVAPAQRQSEIAVKTFLLLAKPDMFTYWPALVRKMHEEAAHEECRPPWRFCSRWATCWRARGKRYRVVAATRASVCPRSNQAIRVIQRGKPKSLVNSVSPLPETALPGRQ